MKLNHEIILVALIWGITPLISKMLLNNFNQSFLSLVNCSIYFTTICLISYNNWDKIKPEFSKLTIPLFIIMLCSTMLGSVIASQLYSRSLKNNTPYVINAITSCSYIFTLVISYLLFNEKLNTYTITGSILVIMGIILSIYGDNN